MLLGLVFLVIVATVPLARGRLTKLADLKLRALWLAPLGIAVQIVIIEIVPAGRAHVHEAIHIFSYLLLGGFCWANRRIPGMPLILLGGALNFIAIAANGGVMPADPELARHFANGAEGFVNSGAMENPHLLFLGDAFSTPQSWPMYNVFSVGDITMELGIFTLLHVVCESRIVPRRLRRRLVPVSA